jgi:hypothetical protein
MAATISSIKTHAAFAGPKTYHWTARVAVIFCDGQRNVLVFVFVPSPLHASLVRSLCSGALKDKDLRVGINQHRW